jgi:hypothetical protein
MAVTDAAVILPSIGHVWTGTVDTATKPTVEQLATFSSAGTVPSGWTDLGHTSLDNILTFGQDAGSTSVKGSWQNSALREIVTQQPVDYFTVQSLQLLDADVLNLYYGGGTPGTDEFATPDTTTPVEKAVTLVMLDGATELAFYCPKASIRADSEMAFASDDFTKIPLRFTPLKHSTNAKSYWIADGLGS